LSQRKDDGGRGNLTNKQWLKLKPLLPPQKAQTGRNQPTATAVFSIYCFGYTELVLFGETSQNVMASTVKFLAGFISGDKPEFGSLLGKV
jgi:hypothetical protein